MPAVPVAKGIILLSSILVAAGIAAYENPEVRAWFKERKRRIALAWDELADELEYQRSTTRRTTYRTDDISTREEASDEAVERRRRARQEIMERGLLIDRKRREANENKLREKSEQTVTTALENPAADQIVRNRTNNTSAATQGSILANPFDDEIGGVINEKALMEEQNSHQPSTAQDTPLQVVTALAPTTGIPESAENPHLSPTTSATLLSATGIMTPTSGDHSILQNDDYLQINPQPVPGQSFQSIQEWASAASSGPESFYSPPESERNHQSLQNFSSDAIHTPSGASSKTASIIGTNEGASEGGDLGVESLSDSGADTPFSWSEISSQVSGDD